MPPARPHILHVTNAHRGGGGSDNAWTRTRQLLEADGQDIGWFERHSGNLPPGLDGKLRAAVGGLYAREAVRAFRRRLAERRPDIVHVHELYPLISPWILPLCRRAGIPVVMTAYDFRLTCPVATHFDGRGLCRACLEGGAHHAFLRNCRDNRFESAAFAARHAIARRLGLFTRNVDHYLVLTRFCAEWLERDVGVPADRVTLSPCVIDLPAVPVADPGAGGYLAFAGRLVLEKGIHTLLEAARLADVPVRLAVRGIETVGHLELPPQVTIFRNRDRAELDDFYRRARAVIVPSIWWESFGIVAAEASALGLPVIASDIGALRETVEHDVTGLRVPPGDAPALAAAMRRLWSDPALGRRFGEAGRAKVAREYSAARHLEAHREAYDRVLAGASRAP